MNTFDPYAKAWNAYESGGQSGLRAVEAPLYVFEPDTDVAERVAANTGGIKPGDLRWMILADAMPVAPVHLNVIGRRQTPYVGATPPEQDGLDFLARRVEALIARIIRPAHGTSVQRFGQQVPTMHQHVLARETEEDGINWGTARVLTDVNARHAMIGRIVESGTTATMTAWNDELSERLSRLYGGDACLARSIIGLAGPPASTPR